MISFLSRFCRALGNMSPKIRGRINILRKAFAVFPTKTPSKSMIQDAGFDNVSVRNLSGGIAATPFRLAAVKARAHSCGPSLRHSFRLFKTACVLAHYDALVPHEFADQIPTSFALGRQTAAAHTRLGAQDHDTKRSKMQAPVKRLAAALSQPLARHI